MKRTGITSIAALALVAAPAFAGNLEEPVVPMVVTPAAFD